MELRGDHRTREARRPVTPDPLLSRQGRIRRSLAFRTGEADDIKYRRTNRDIKIKTYGNWMLSMGGLYLREPDADRYAMFQDDMIRYRQPQNLPRLGVECPREWDTSTYTLSPRTRRRRRGGEGSMKVTSSIGGARPGVPTGTLLQTSFHLRHMIDRNESIARGIRRR